MKTGRIITALLALLGFAACDDDNGGGGGMVMYGIPSASFQISGRVTDQAGEPIRDVKIVIKDIGPNHHEGEVGVGITNAGGHYYVVGSWGGGQMLSVATEDIDGDKNGGEFADQNKELKIEPEDYIGGGEWNRGTVIKSADFTLTLKPQADENE